jgi:hypothetical protein
MISGSPNTHLLPPCNTNLLFRLPFQYKSIFLAGKVHTLHNGLSSLQRRIYICCR